MTRIKPLLLTKAHITKHYGIEGDDLKLVLHDLGTCGVFTDGNPLYPRADVERSIKRAGLD